MLALTKASFKRTSVVRLLRPRTALRFREARAVTSTNTPPGRYLRNAFSISTDFCLFGFLLLWPFRNFRLFLAAVEEQKFFPINFSVRSCKFSLELLDKFIGALCQCFLIGCRMLISLFTDNRD